MPSRLNVFRYENILDNLLEGLQIIDSDWRYIYVNKSAARHGHKTPQSLIGHKMLEIYPGIEKTEMFCRFARLHGKSSTTSYGK